MTANTNWFDDQVAAFSDLRKEYKIFATLLRDILENAAASLGIAAIVQGRAKTIASFAEKIQRKKDKYVDPVHQLTDLCGARVITDTLEQTRSMCRFIRDHFDIDEANSLDVLDRLDAAAFGYRSVHFIVSLRPGVFPDIPEVFYEQAEAASESGQAGLPGPKFRAEIQVRTLLQHAWATIAHDKLYKSAFPIPSGWTREAARIAALLEDADASFERLLDEVSAYTSHFGAYMTQAQISDEIVSQEAVLACDPGNVGIARRIARLAMAAADYDKAMAVLMPFEAGGDWLVLRDLAEARLLSGESSAVALGRAALNSLVADHPDDARSLELLADSQDDAAAALHLAERAFQAAPEEPRILRRFLERKVARERQAGFLALLHPAMDKALDLSRQRARLGIGLPWTCHDIGLLELFRGRPYPGLEALALAVALGGSARDADNLHRSLYGLIDAVGEALPGLEWARRFLELVRKAGSAVGAQDARSPEQLCREDFGQACQGGLQGPVVIVAGGCHAHEEHRIEAYRSVLVAAFEDFQGTVISGGTTAGISGLIGELPGVKTGAIRLLGYLPGELPRAAAVHARYEIRDCDGRGFTPLGVLQGWMDILASGIRPEAVRVLGVNGGDIATVEYVMAAALGARVGLLRESGRAVHKVLSDPLWAGRPNILSLPSDAVTVGEFLRPPAGAAFAAEEIEAMARLVHENYRREQKQKSVKSDAAMADWDDLCDGLKNSNRSVAAHDVLKLRSVGLGLRRQEPDAIMLYALSAEQIEAMAELEHARWNMERLEAGWRPGARDHAAKTSPYLVPWTELSEEIKQYDRDNVRLIPDRLKEIGYEVYPLAAEAGGAQS